MTTTRQPSALPYLFLTEMWERFGFYIVQGLLVLYASEQLGFSDNTSYALTGTFTSFAYISPFVGGYLADRFLGFKTATLWGGCFLLFGYFLLAVSFTQFFFYIGLAVIVIGTGLLKPSISNILGAQYERDDHRREVGFTIFYIGINLGATMAGLTSGYIKEYFGWYVNFALGSVGLLIGLSIFLYGLRYFHLPKPKTLEPYFKIKLFLYCLIAIAGLTFLFHAETITNYLLPCFGIVLLVFLTYLTLQQTPEYQKRMLLLNILILSSIIFWTMYWQIFLSANLFIARLVDNDFFGLHLTTTVFYASVNIFIIFLGPLFAWLWHALGRYRRNPSPIYKFIVSLVLTGSGFVVLANSTDFPNANGLINPLWIFSAYFLITIGELLLSPIGLSAVTTLAPENLVGMMMGAWFVATGFGGIFAGMIAKFANIPDAALSQTDKLEIYHHAFLQYAYMTFTVAIVLFFVHLSLKKILRS